MLKLLSISNCIPNYFSLVMYRITKSIINNTCAGID